jgi:hypothetical protein
MNTTVQKVALVLGLGFIAAAIAGFIAAGTAMEPTDPESAHKALGLFPVNLLHNAVHLAFGSWGIVAARNFFGARNFCRIGGVAYALLVPLGIIVPDGFGLIPLGGHDVWLHALFAVTMLYFGFTAKPARA